MTKALRPRALFIDRMASPIGAILIAHDADGRLRALDFEDYEPRMLELLRRHYGKQDVGFTLARRSAPAPIRRALAGYFDGDLAALDALPVATAGTPFQRSVWTALRKIRPGTTMSYGALARRIGRPTSMRAVGLANGANPISIVVPCHRVIGADGSLTGYGGGLERKRWLLAHEGVAGVLPARSARRAA